MGFGSGQPSADSAVFLPSRIVCAPTAMSLTYAFSPSARGLIAPEPLFVHFYMGGDFVEY